MIEGGIVENIWTTQTGQKVNVKDMTSRHILNTLKLIENGGIIFTINLGWETDNDFQSFDENEFARERWIKIFRDELERRTNMLCVQCSKYPFCKGIEENKTECNKFIKRKLGEENEKENITRAY